MESSRKKEKKKDRGRETCVSLLVSGASTQETTQTEKGEIKKEEKDKSE